MRLSKLLLIKQGTNMAGFTGLAYDKIYPKPITWSSHSAEFRSNWKAVNIFLTQVSTFKT